MSKPIDATLAEEMRDYIKNLNEASELYLNISAKAYNQPPGENDINLYEKIINRIEEIDSSKVDKFKEIIEHSEPNISKLNDTAQKIAISSVLTKYLYRLKANNPELIISNTLLYIPFALENEEWLSVMSKITIPVLVNNNLI